MGIKIIAKNKRASYDFAIQEKIEAGLVLQGTEVKSLRNGKCIIADAYCHIDPKKEAWVNHLIIPPYEFGTYDNHVDNRKRKLLLNAKEIEYIDKAIKTKGLTLIPIAIYFKKSKVKLELALAKGKKLHDKREATKKKEIDRKIRQGQYD